MYTKIIITFVCFILFNHLFSQETYSGKIIDSKTNKAIQYVNIYVKGTQIGTVSNIEGKFDLTIPKTYKNDTLVFSFMGYYQYKNIVSGFQKNQTIKLVPFVNKIEGVQVEAKRTSALDILLKAEEKLSENCIHADYDVEIYSRNIVKKDSKIVSYRKTQISGQIRRYDYIFGNGGRINADFRLSRNIPSTDQDHLFNSHNEPIKRDYIRKVKKKTYQWRRYIKTDTVIFSENSKVFVIDIYKKNIDSNLVKNIDSFVRQNLSPYAMVLDSNLSNVANSIIDKNILFIRYYIDAKQNYNIVKVARVSGMTTSAGFKKKITFNYIITDYTNIPGKSAPEKVLSYKHGKYNTDTNTIVNIKSVFEAYYYDFIYKPANIVYSDKRKLFFQYNDGKNSVYDKWNNYEDYIKQDKLVEEAIKELRK